MIVEYAIHVEAINWITHYFSFFIENDFTESWFVFCFPFI